MNWKMLLKESSLPCLKKIIWYFCISLCRLYTVDTLVWITCLSQKDQNVSVDYSKVLTPRVIKPHVDKG